ncbi:MAG: glycosyltransferase family 4 protein [Phycisphaerae bacterium]|nr:glycosyltransferase family 4 protein [Phycisphaerae bacterium]
MTHDLAIIGPVPPPYGGVTIHLKRLLPHLDRAGVDYIVYNISPEPTSNERIVPVGEGGRGWFVRYLRKGREPVVYVHSSRWDVWAATWWLSRVRGKSVVIALHTDSLRRLWPVRPWWYRRMVLAAFRRAKSLVAVNEHIRDFLEEVGGLGDRTVVIPAFVEPTPSAEDEAGIDASVREFCRSHDPVILANGAPIVYDDGRDLYGIDMTIELVDRLRGTWPSVGVLWYLLKFTGWSPAYARQMVDEVDRRGLGDHWRFVDPTGEMYPIFKEVDLLVRPTCSDGDAVSIREALHFGVPVVASDAAPRPAGVVEFKARDQDDFVGKVLDTLESLGEQRSRLAGMARSSEIDREVGLLREVIAEARRPSA